MGIARASSRVRISAERDDSRRRGRTTLNYTCWRRLPSPAKRVDRQRGPCVCAGSGLREVRRAANQTGLAWALGRLLDLFAKESHLRTREHGGKLVPNQPSAGLRDDTGDTKLRGDQFIGAGLGCGPSGRQRVPTPSVSHNL